MIHTCTYIMYSKYLIFEFKFNNFILKLLKFESTICTMYIQCSLQCTCTFVVASKNLNQSNFSKFTCNVTVTIHIVPNK